MSYGYYDVRERDEGGACDMRMSFDAYGLHDNAVFVSVYKVAQAD